MRTRYADKIDDGVWFVRKACPHHAAAEVHGEQVGVARDPVRSVNEPKTVSLTKVTSPVASCHTVLVAWPPQQPSSHAERCRSPAASVRLGNPALPLRLR